MDLIYADSTGHDIGIFDSYTLDAAFGEDENDFQLTIPIEAHCCESGYFVYFEGGDVGGTIDRIGIDTIQGSVTYRGRTWHGILAGKVICPDSGKDYLVLSGDANTVLASLIQRVGLAGVFQASSSASGIQVVSYTMDRYVDAYTGIRKMLRESDAKLRIRWKNRKVVLSAVPLSSYSWSEDLDTSQAGLSASRAFRATNHIVCLGGGELAGRAVIHLFTDANGGIQPFATTENPLEDSDYITDLSGQILTGEDEITEVLDYPSADGTRNYIPLGEKPADWEKDSTKYFAASEEGYAPVTLENRTIYKLQKAAPADWSVNCHAYYKKDGPGYVPVTSVTSYSALTQKPSDWDDDYDEYYTQNSGTYTTVRGVSVEEYIPLTAMPLDWHRKWSAYYYYYTDGVTTEYRRVSGYSHDRYLMQTRMPTDWNANYGRYYKRKKNGGYEAVTAVKDAAPRWQAKTYYTKQTYETAPIFIPLAFYAYKKTTEAPAFAAGAYYKRDDDTAPTWERNKYYTKNDVERAPRFAAGGYFKAVTDRYAVLVASGIDRLRAAWQTEELNVNAAAAGKNYDIGDIVAASDAVTGLSVTQEVVKIIVRVENGEETTEYIMK